MQQFFFLYVILRIFTRVYTYFPFKSGKWNIHIININIDIVTEELNDGINEKLCIKQENFKGVEIKYALDILAWGCFFLHIQ